MDLSRTNIKRRSTEVIGFLRVHWFATLVLILLALYAFNEFQRWRDRKAVSEQTERLQQFDDKRAKSAAETETLQMIFDKQHQSTVEILNAMNAMSGTINNLVQNDLRQDKAVNDLQKEYHDARNPNSSTKTNIAVRSARNSQPLRQREDSVLSTDRELYPADDGGAAGK